MHCLNSCFQLAGQSAAVVAATVLSWGGERSQSADLPVFPATSQHLAAGLGSVWPAGAGLFPAASAGSVHQAYGAWGRCGGCASGSCTLQHQQHVHWIGLPGDMDSIAKAAVEWQTWYSMMSAATNTVVLPGPGPSIKHSGAAQHHSTHHTTGVPLLHCMAMHESGVHHFTYV